MRYPKWIPYPVSWLNALALSGLMSFYLFCVPGFARMALLAIGFPTRTWMGYYRYAIEAHLVFAMGLLFLVVFIILPVLFIAFPHHWLHLVLSKYFPKAQAASVGVTKGWFPGLMSWWESLWGWFVAIFGIALAIGLSFVVLPELWACPTDLSICTNRSGVPQALTRFVGFAWFFSAAYLYQLQFLVEGRILRNKKPKTV